MPTTIRIRTAAAVLAAALSIGVATVPVASDAYAAKNDGRYQKSVEAKKQTLKSQCADLQRDWKDQIAISESLEEQNLDAARESDDKADDLMDKAGHMGCSWAL